MQPALFGNGAFEMEVYPDPEKLGLSPARLARIKTWMQKYIDDGKLPGATTLVARHGQIAFCETMGYGDLEKKKPLARDSILRFYSMSKPVTATAVMMLYEKGLFQLDDPLSDYISAFKNMQVYCSGSGGSMITQPAAAPITIHHLLTHTSGLPDWERSANPEALGPRIYSGDADLSQLTISASGSNGQLMVWFPPFDHFPGPPGAYPNTTSTITGGIARNRMLRGLVVAQLAVVFMLTNGTVLLIKSYRNVLMTPQVFDTDEVLTANISLAGGEGDPEADQARVEFWESILERCAALVEHAAAVGDA